MYLIKQTEDESVLIFKTIKSCALLAIEKVFNVLVNPLETAVTPNGTAVEGVCVTGAAIRLTVPFVSKETVPVASWYGAVFAKSRAAGFAIAVYDDSL